MSERILHDVTIAILALMSFTPFLMTLLNFVFGQSHFWKFLHGLVVAVPVETVRFERSIHFNDCNTSWVNLNIVSLYKPVSLTKIKVLCCLNVDDLLSRTLLLTIVTPVSTAQKPVDSLDIPVCCSGQSPRSQSR